MAIAWWRFLSNCRYGGPRGGNEAIGERGHLARQPAVCRELDGLEHDAEHDRGSEVRVLLGNLSGRDRGTEDVANDVDGGQRFGGEPAELPVLDEEQKPEERRVLVMRPAEFPDHRGDLGASAAFAPRQRLKLAGELDVVPLEDRPDQLFLAHEV